MNPYLDQEDYRDAYADAQKHMRKFFEPFDEFERLMANKLRDDLPDNMPKVNDGSLAALLLETPMRVLAQMMNGNVKVLHAFDPKDGKKVDPQPWLSELANVYWNQQIVPNANTQAAFFTKWQVALYKALGYGAQPILDFFTVRGNYKGADIVLPYVRDVYLEPGKVSDLDSNYIIMDSWYTRADLNKLISEAKQAKKDGVETSWDVESLQTVYDDALKDEKDSRNKNKSERDKGLETPFTKLTTIFQRGIKAPFCTFHEGGDTNGMTIVREKENDDPTGDIPIHYLYAYEDLVNPLGKSQTEISGGTQNVLDYLTQADVLATMIGIQPPIHVKGDRSETDLNSLVYAPRQLWLEGVAEVSTEQTASQVYGQFPSRYGLYKTQLLNAQGSTTADVSADSGSPGFSKTPAGVDAQQARTNAHDNFLRQQVNSTFARVSKRMLNITFANMQGIDILKVADDDAARLSLLGLIDNDPQTGKPSTNEIAMTWKNLRGQFDFEVDPESSIVKDDADNVNKLTEVLTIVSKTPEIIQAIGQSGHQFDVGELATAIFTRMGLQDVEKIIKPLTNEDGTPANGQTGQPAANGQVPPEVNQLVQQTMQQYGIDQPAALAVLHAKAIGVPENMIAQYLQSNPDKAGTPAPQAPPVNPAAQVPTPPAATPVGAPNAA